MGKIAQLPYDIRHDLNGCLLEGEQSDTLLEWLNGLEEVQEVLKEQFDGKPISKQNLSDWRRGGYAEWLLQEDLSDQASALQSQAKGILDASSPLLADNLLTVFTVRYSGLVTHWDGKVTRSFDARLKVFTRMRRDLMKLQEAAQHSARNQRELEERDAQLRRDINAQTSNYAEAPFMASLRRRDFTRMYGEEAGNAMADMMDMVHYSKHELWGTAWFGQKLAKKPHNDNTDASSKPQPSAAPQPATSTAAQPGATTEHQPTTPNQPPPRLSASTVNQPSSQALSQGMVEKTESLENQKHSAENQASESSPVKPSCEGGLPQ